MAASVPTRKAARLVSEGVWVAASVPPRQAARLVREGRGGWGSQRTATPGRTPGEGGWGVEASVPPRQAARLVSEGREGGASVPPRQAARLVREGGGGAASVPPRKAARLVREGWGLRRARRRACCRQRTATRLAGTGRPEYRLGERHLSVRRAAHRAAGRARVRHAVLEALQAQVAAVRDAQPARLGLQGAESGPGQPVHAAHDGRGLQAEGAGALLHCCQPFSSSQLQRGAWALLTGHATCLRVRSPCSFLVLVVIYLMTGR